MNKFWLPLCALALCLGGPAPAQAKDLQIGALFPLSGPNASYGDVFKTGVDLASEHVNADHMLKGNLLIRYEDSQAKPQTAVVSMTKLVNVDQVPYVLSAFTGVSKAISPLAMRNQVVAVNGGGVGPDLAQLGEYFWNVIPLANLEVRGVVPYVVKQLKLPKVVLIYVDDPLGQAILKELETELPKAGGKLVEKMSVPTTAQQFAGIAAKVRAASPDAIFLASYGAQQLQIVKQLRDNGVTAQIVTYSGYSIPDALALPESEGLIYTTQAVNFSSDDPITQRFVKDYKAKFNQNPTAYSVNYYNAVRLFGLLAHELEAKGKEITGANLLAQRRATPSFAFVGGTVSFEDNGTLIAPIQINVIKNGAGEAVKTVNVGH